MGAHDLGGEEDAGAHDHQHHDRHQSPGLVVKPGAIREGLEDPREEESLDDIGGRGDGLEGDGCHDGGTDTHGMAQDPSHEDTNLFGILNLY